MTDDPTTSSFWNERYATGDTGWDIGYVSTPLRSYFDQLTDKDLRILIPGAGRSYEAGYLHEHGFTQVFVMDLVRAPFDDLLELHPTFPKEHLLVGDFFAHEGQYGLIIEQTFFCALPPSERLRYVQHMHRLLRPGGKLVGVLFGVEFEKDGPPYGGTKEEYDALFRAVFTDLHLEPCHNSIPSRMGRELWLQASKDQ